MSKSIRGTPKKKRGRPPTTGRGTQIGMRWQDPELSAIDVWREKNDIATRSDAIRRLVQLGLTVKVWPKRPSHTRAARANELARKTIDDLVDPAAQTEEAASRKRRLLKGPEEFWVRVDGGKKK